MLHAQYKNRNHKFFAYMNWANRQVQLYRKYCRNNNFRIRYSSQRSFFTHNAVLTGGALRRPSERSERCWAPCWAMTYADVLKNTTNHKLTFSLKRFSISYTDLAITLTVPIEQNNAIWKPGYVCYWFLLQPWIPFSLWTFLCPFELQDPIWPLFNSPPFYFFASARYAARYHLRFCAKRFAPNAMLTGA